MRPMTTESLLPAPRDAIFSVLYYLALAVIVGAVDVEHFDQVINALIVATAGELQGELAQFKLIVKRVLVDAG